MGNEFAEELEKRLRDEIKRAVVIDGDGRATYMEVMKSLAKVNLEPSEEGMIDSISDILGEDFKLIIKDEEIGIQCTETLKVLDDVSFPDEKFLLTKRQEGGFEVESVIESQE